jgi:hypothetical protein
LFALSLFGVTRVAFAQADADQRALHADDEARLKRAQDAFRAGDAKQAAAIARPLYDAYPNNYGVQDLRCQCAILRYLSREEIAAECAGIKRLAAAGAIPSQRKQAEAPPPPSTAPAPPPAEASPAPLPQTEEAERGEPPLPPSALPVPEPPPPSVTPRDLTALRYRGFGWSVRPGVLWEHGTAGFSLEGQVEYGFDTGVVVVLPGVSVEGFFVQPNTYVEMATMKLVAPVGWLALFVEGGAGVGQVGTAQAALALMGGGGFAFHPGPSLGLGLELGYETVRASDVQLNIIIIGPIVSLRF